MLGPQWVVVFGEAQRGALVGGMCHWGYTLRVSRLLLFPVCSLLGACGSRRERSASVVAAILPVMRESQPSGTIRPNKPFLQ